MRTSIQESKDAIYARINAKFDRMRMGHTSSEDSEEGSREDSQH